MTQRHVDLMTLTVEITTPLRYVFVHAILDLRKV